MRTAEGTATIAPSERAAGRVTIPGDKSISHRYAMLAALADGVSILRGYATGFDCRTTLACLRALGIGIEWTPGQVTIVGRGPRGFIQPAGVLDAENSGTTMRLLSGILAGLPLVTTMTGDGSLRRRPMRRVIGPLTEMGARVDAEDDRPPLTIHGAALHGIRHRPEVPSAQIKSCVLLAGLLASGTTTVEEIAPTRDHTERALETFTATVRRGPGTITIDGGQSLEARDLTVPGDISGAAFWAALAAGTPGGDITIEGVGLNPTRTAVLDILRRAGAHVSVTVDDPESPEPSGRIHVTAAHWNDFTVAPDDVPGVIDEIPALAALAAMMPAGRTFEVRGARELRVKESDRITALADGFRAMGSEIEEFDDGFRLRARPLHGAVVDSAGDHRLAMAFAIAATRASQPVKLEGFSAAAVSYPEFFDTLGRLTSST
ncbi:MAG: 3-phosphoshikimate 1-carboxyvinyltransferase [Vicinamibacterales bacterium]